MKCEKVQDELLLYFGRQELPEQLREHLSGCAECERFWLAAASVAQSLDRDEDFYADESEVEGLVARVDNAIDNIELGKFSRTASIWKTYLPVAAVVALMIGISLIVFLLGSFGSERSQMASDGDDSLLVLYEEGTSAELNEEDMRALLYDFATEQHESASEQLIDDLTEEEYEYLQKSLDIGEIL